MEPLTSHAIVLPIDNIDTDRIIPARFMKCVTFDGLGYFAFYDVRFDPDSGEKTGHPLNDTRFDGASILLAGVNFGCGSSREHAPQSLSVRYAPDASTKPSGGAYSSVASASSGCAL